MTPKQHHEESDTRRLHEGSRITRTGLFLNLLLIALKLTAGILGHSEALIADAFHSFSDAVTDGLVLLGLRWSSRPSDQHHPYGHGKIETLTTLFVGLAIIGVAARIGYGGFTALFGTPARPSFLPLVAALVSIVTKELLYRYTVIKGRQLSSKVLVANAWHHRSDAISSLIAIAGVAGSMAGITILDPLAAIVVTALIAYVGIKIMISTVGELVDASADANLVRIIEETASAVPGVANVHGVRARYVGPWVTVQLHLVVAPKASVEESHALAHQVEEAIVEQIGEVRDVVIHVEPAHRD